MFAIDPPLFRLMVRRVDYRTDGLLDLLANLRYGAGAIRTARRIRRLSEGKLALADIFFCYENFNILCTSPEFQPFAERFDSSWFFAGPVLDGGAPEGPRTTSSSITSVWSSSHWEPSFRDPPSSGPSWRTSPISMPG